MKENGQAIMKEIMKENVQIWGVSEKTNIRNNVSMSRSNVHPLFICSINNGLSLMSSQVQTKRFVFIWDAGQCLHLRFTQTDQHFVNTRG